MFKQIVVPVDLSHLEKSTRMIGQAKELADQSSAAMHLVNVVADLPGYVTAQIPADLRINAEKEAETALRDLVTQHGLPDTTVVKILHGSPAREIVRHAKDTGADVIVIASHTPGFSDYLLGSVASSVVRHASCSVVVLR
jgi:nucleotide-binding universal stress UspA family protein